MRRAARVDAIQAAIVSALRDHGCTVQSLAAVGRGCPDLLVGYRGRNYLLEVKTPGTQYGRRPNKVQQRWHEEWHGHVAIVRTVADALTSIGE